jgi:hypothetical protein
MSRALNQVSSLTACRLESRHGNLERLLYGKLEDSMPRAFVDPFAGKPKKAAPFAFVLETLEALQPRTNPMFGCLAVYVGPKIMLVLRDKPGGRDNGVWLATTHEHHESLRAEFPSMRSISVLGRGKETGWQILPAEAPDFEEAAQRACELIAARDPRIGKVPKTKSRRRKPRSEPRP